MIFFDVSQAQEVAMVILLHGLEGEDYEEAPVPSQTMGREQLVRLSRVAAEVGDDRQDDKVGRRGINEEQEQVSDDNACCKTAIAKADFICARRAWPGPPDRAGISPAPIVYWPRLIPLMVRSTERASLQLRASHPSRSRARS
jgi:hypothetical protein